MCTDPPFLLEPELGFWESFWQNYSNPNFKDHHGMSVQAVLTVCEECNDLKNTVPIIYQCLRILGTVPVTSCECERSISVMKRLKTYLRSTMTQSRFSSLALLTIKRDFHVDLDEAINTFATRHAQRMLLLNLGDGDLGNVKLR